MTSLFLAFCKMQGLTLLLSSAVLTVYSSEHWLESMEDLDDIASSACNDRPDDD